MLFGRKHRSQEHNDTPNKPVVRANNASTVKNHKQQQLYERIAYGNALAEIEEAAYKRHRR
jgi:hypothetical protein